jgi:cytochrome c oxidase assembly protein subunit 15
MKYVMYNKIIKISFFLAIFVVIMGAYTRISNAGLSCPDWPGCYGKIIVPNEIDGTEIEGYERPLEVAKAWKEMIHRYAASILGLMVFVILILTISGKQQLYQSIYLPSFTAFFILLQGLFGAWTVTLLLHPVIVTTHLIGGFITVLLITWLLLNQQRKINLTYIRVAKHHKFFLIATLLILFIQIILGGWTSANYAALSCGNEFPTCLGSILPNIDISKAISFGEFNTNYEYGVLENDARVAVQMIHRIGALVSTVAVFFMAYLFKNYLYLKSTLTIILTLLVLQLILGILNVMLSLPVITAVLHNVVALFLMIAMLVLAHKVFKVML